MMEETKETTQPTPEELKELGNHAIRNKKFAEAVLQYSLALKLDPSNHLLYSNRSYAYLKMQHYYNALEDANRTVWLNPTGAKGYFRKGEIEFATRHYGEAMQSYEQALFFMPEDETIKSCLVKATTEYMRDKQIRDKIPWVVSGIGIVIGVTLIILDYLYTSRPTHPLLMALITIAISLIGYGIGKGYCYYDTCQRDSLIQPPPNLFGDDDNGRENNKNDNNSRGRARFTKSQARHRYKKGKL